MKRISPLFLSLKLILLAICLPAFTQEPEDITIDKGRSILKGRFYKAADDDIKPVVILLQGSPGNTYDVLGLGRLLSMSGINAMTFNYSGSHQSTGTFSFHNCQSDIEANYGSFTDLMLSENSGLILRQSSLQVILSELLHLLKKMF